MDLSIQSNITHAHSGTLQRQADITEHRGGKRHAMDASWSLKVGRIAEGKTYVQSPEKVSAEHPESGAPLVHFMESIV